MNISAAEIATLDLKPGDRVVLSCPGLPSHSQIEQMRAQLQALFPDHKCLILPGGMKLSVIREDEPQTKFREFL